MGTSSVHTRDPRHARTGTEPHTDMPSTRSISVCFNLRAGRLRIDTVLSHRFERSFCADSSPPMRLQRFLTSTRSFVSTVPLLEGPTPTHSSHPCHAQTKNHVSIATGTCRSLRFNGSACLRFVVLQF